MANRVGIIYSATNDINGMIYIGQTITDLNKRIEQHKHRSKTDRATYFHNAISKYGIDNFTWEIIEKTNRIDLLNKLEKHYIDIYSSFDNNFGYNLTDGGNSFRMSPEVVRKSSLRKKGIKRPWMSEIARKKIMQQYANGWSPRKGKKHTEATKIKMSLSKKGKRLGICNHPMTEEIKMKISAANKGKIQSEERKNKTSIAVTKWWAKRKAMGGY